MTVREQLVFHAALRMSHKTKSEQIQRVEHVIEQMGLTKCKDTGNHLFPSLTVTLTVTLIYSTLKQLNHLKKKQDDNICCFDFFLHRSSKELDYLCEIDFIQDLQIAGVVHSALFVIEVVGFLLFGRVDRIFFLI